MPKYGNPAPGSQKGTFSKKNSFFWKSLQISLPWSPQPPQPFKFKSSYARKRDYAQIWKFRPRLPKMEFCKKIHFFEKVSRFRFQWALNNPRHLSLSQVMQENVIMPKYGNSAPGYQKWNYSKKINFFWKGLQISLPTSPQPPQTLSLSQVMQENVILAYYAQIWKFGPRLLKMEFFKKFSFFWKGLQISILTSPQARADIKFKSSYARKHIIKKVESRTQLLNTECRSYQSFT